MTGQTISRYRVAEKLGEGGMGVVYRATDIDLGRQAALKFLLPHLADVEAIQRFLREAQAAATLSHSNVCTVYEIDAKSAHPFIAMEFVDGGSVAEKIKPQDSPARPLPMEDALDIAIQIAGGLQAAHEKGVTHRDIKCANILLTRAGQVKLTDFGLAYLAERSRLTKSDTTMGTPAYMSPEQVLGKPTDRRTDIWALGVVLYEMLTGRLPFDGEYEQAVTYSIVNEDPEPVTGLRAGLPLELDRIISKALAKDPAERYQHVDDFATDLRAVRRALEAGVAKTKTEPAETGKVTHDAARWKSYIPWAIAAVFGAALLFLLIRDNGPQPAPPREARFVIPIPPEQRVTAVADWPFDISPDGSRLVYAAESGGATRLYSRRIDEFDADPLPGTEGARYPFFSPDGRWVGFFAEGQLLKISLSGGTPTPVCRTEGEIAGGSWGSDGTMVYGSHLGLRRVSENGGDAEAVLPDVAEGERHLWPSHLPDGKTVMFSSTPYPLALNIVSLATGERRRVVEHGGQGRYVPSGHIVFGRSGAVQAIAFDLESLQPIGGAYSLVDDVAEARASGAVYYRVAGDGSLYFVPGRNEHSLVRADRAGRVTPLTGRRAGYRGPASSPDGRHIAVVIDPPDEGHSDIWVLDVERGAFTRLSTEAHNLSPEWIPDSERVIWSRGRDLMWRSITGAGAASLVHTHPRTQYPRSVSPDGRLVVISPMASPRNFDLWAYPLAGGGEAFPLVESPYNEHWADISPNGRWLAYSSTESGRNEVYVRGFPEGSRRWTVSTEGGHDPKWSRDGKELFYVGGARMMAVPVRTEGEFTSGGAQFLFERRDMLASDDADYDVLGDGFVIVQRDPLAQMSEFRVIQNWTSGLTSASEAVR